MRKLLVFLLLFGLAFSLEVDWKINKLPDSVSKPWEGYWINEYSSGYGSKTILNCEVMHKSLEDLNLNSLDYVGDADVVEKIDEAKQNYAVASAKKQKCEYYFIFEDNRLDFRGDVLDQIYEKAENAYQDALKKNETDYGALGCMHCIQFTCADSAGILYGAACAAYIATDIIDSHDACLDYAIYWKATMTSSAQALEMSAKKANEKYDILEEGYENLTKAGMCSENYTWKGKQTCDEIAQELLEAEAESSSALGGHEGIAKRIAGYSDAMKSVSIINTSNYSLIMGDIWKVAIPYTEEKTEECSTAMKNAVDDYVLLKTNTENKKSTAQEWVEKCKSEGLTDIDFAFIGGNNVIGGTTDIKEGCETAEEEYKTAEDECKLSDTAYKEKAGDWLLKAFQYEESCYEKFDSAAEDGKKAYENAEQTVSSLREMASEAISSAEGNADPETLQSAKNEFNAGETASTLGEKAIHYNKAWELANAAMAAFVPENITSPEMEEQFNTLKAEVEGMLSRAQTDGIDITTEKSLYEYYVSLGPTQEAIDGLQKVMDMILDKAIIAYGDLEYLREEIYDGIESANGAFDYLLPELNALEAGYVKDGEIDFAAALGHLANMKQGYLDILEEMENQKEEAYSGSVIWTYSKDYEPARLDEESQITMYIYATNPNAFTVAGGEKSFDFPFEVMQSEVSGKLVGVVSDGQTLTLYPEDFEPFESRTFVVSTSQIIASTSSQDVYAMGYDGKADVKDSRLVEFLGPSEGLYLPDEWETISIDGYEFDAGSGFISKKFNADFYEITGTYTVIDAYDWEEENYNSITVGTTTTLSYDVVIDSKIHIDEMKFVVEGDNIDAYASGGSSVEVSGQEVIVYDVDEGETTLHIKYEISNANEYINQEIDELSDEIDGDECPEAEQALNDAILAYQNGNINLAMEKIKEAKALWEKYKRGVEKAQAQYEKYLDYVNQQLEQIKKALARADSLGLSGGFIDSLRERKSSIESFVAGLENLAIEEKVSKLKSFDKNWLKKEAGKFLKDAFSEVGDKKKEYYNLGVADPELDGLFNEFEANYKKARASEADYTPHVDTYASLLKIRSAFEQTVADKDSQLSQMLSEFEQIKEETTALITQYTNEYNDGKKTPYESLFQFLPKYYSKKLSAIEKEVKKTNKPTEIAKRIEKVKKLKQELASKLDVFKKSAEEMLSLVEREFAKAKPNLNSKTKESVESAIQTIKQSIANGRYVKAMNTANNVLITLGKVKSGGMDFILWFGVLLLILAGVFYYVRSGGKLNLEKMGLGGLFKEENKKAKLAKKPLKKLERVK